MIYRSNRNRWDPGTDPIDVTDGTRTAKGKDLCRDKRVCEREVIGSLTGTKEGAFGDFRQRAQRGDGFLSKDTHIGSGRSLGMRNK